MDAWEAVPLSKRFEEVMVSSFLLLLSFSTAVSFQQGNG